MSKKSSIQEKKDFIRKHKRRGEIAYVCRGLDYSTSVFWSAMGREDDRYTGAEIDVIHAMYFRLHEREKKKKSLGLTV